MLLSIPGLLSTEEVARVRAIIDAAEWIDGKATAGHQSALVKRNEQLPEGSPAAREAGAVILSALERSPLFIAAALPLKVYPPLFNRYGRDQHFGTHVDNAIRIRRGSDFRIRSDLSMTVFLADPGSYDGGELEVEDLFGGKSVKLGAGDAVLYPSSSLHKVAPVTRGVRVASFFWIQSMVRDEGERTMLLELDKTVQALGGERGHADPHVVALTGLYHNLLRRWGEV